MIKGPNSETDKAAWLEFRRGGLTATEIRDLAKGYAADRRRILQEKVTGERPDLSGNQYIEWGNLREPVIQEWILERFGIQPSASIYGHDEDPGRLATPDGLLVDDFTEEVLVAEIKTSKHDLTPGRLDGDRVLYEVARGSHFAKTGYYDQMQWQMHVVGATLTLFAWEGHNDNWSGWPGRGPVPTEISHAWVPIDRARIAELIKIYDQFQIEVAAARALAEETGETPDAEAVLPEEEADLARQVIEARAEESAAKKKREAAWARLLEIAKERGDDFRASGEGVRVSWTTSRKMVPSFDEARARAKAPAVFRRFEEIREKYTTEQEKISHTLNVGTAK